MSKLVTDIALGVGGGFALAGVVAAAVAGSSSYLEGWDPAAVLGLGAVVGAIVGLAVHEYQDSQERKRQAAENQKFLEQLGMPHLTGKDRSPPSGSDT
jgi:hypothetical protein